MWERQIMNSYRKCSALRSLKRVVLTLALIPAAGLCWGIAGVSAQETILLKKELEAAKGQQGTVTIHPDIPPGSTTSGKHYHPGDQFVYVLEGNGTLQVEGQSPLSLKPGVTYYVAPHQVHEVTTSSSGPLKGVGVTIAKPGEPLIVPVK
jgi:quercetin dioxygenase-like cupin family protein